MKWLQVSWVRHEGLHIIGAGRYTYTSDQRFQAIHPEDSNDWILRIRNVRSADQGRYECQINTKDHKSYPFNLKVVGRPANLINNKLNARSSHVNDKDETLISDKTMLSVFAN